MALTIGELVGFLTLDDSMFERGLEKGKESFAKVGTFFKDHGQAMGAAAGATAGTALAVGIATNLELGAGRAKLDAQLDLTAADAKTAGKAAGQLYAGDFAGSLDEANEAIKAVVQNMNISAKDVNLEPIAAQALTVSQILGEDVGRTTAAVSTLMKTGLAKNSQEAFDILAKGAQLGVNKADDLLDTFTEYPTTFDALGISGKDALGLMNQGLKAGARNSDLVADAIKEFSIRAIDGSKSTQQGFKAMGMDADDMRDRIAKGGPSARKAFGEVLDGLRKIEDPAKRQAAAVELFGTKAEDMGKSLQAMDLDSSAEGLENMKGAADRASNALGSSAQSKIDSFRKKVQIWTSTLVEADGPVGAIAAGVAAFGGSVIGAIAPIGTLVLAHRAASAAARADAAAETAAGVASSRSWLRSAAAAVAGAVRVVAAYVMTKVQAVGSAAASAAAFAVMAAGWVAAGARAMAGAVRIGAAWLLSKVQLIPTIALYTIAFALMAAGWIASAAASMAGAVVMAAAWFIALGPIAWAIAAVALIAVVVIKYWDQISGFTKKVWGYVSGVVTGAVSWVIEFVKAHWPLILAIITGPIGLAVLVITKNMDKIKAVMAAVWGAIRSAAKAAWNGVTSVISNGASSIVNAVKGIPGKLRGLGNSFASAGRSLIGAFVGGLKNAGGVISGIAGNVWKAVKTLLNGAIDRINSALEFRISLPLGKHITIDPKDIPHLATGGRATSDTLAVIGDGNEPESVLPDSMLEGLLNRAYNAGAGQGGTGNGGPAVHIDMPITTQETQDNQQIGRTISDRLMFQLSMAGVGTA